VSEKETGFVNNIPARAGVF